jgi:hypothetical protein
MLTRMNSMPISTLIPLLIPWPIQRLADARLFAGYARLMRVWVACPVMLALALMAGQAGAQSPSVFTVSGVAVDEVAESAEVARKKALANGERKAFERLFRRLTWPIKKIRKFAIWRN